MHQLWSRTVKVFTEFQSTHRATFWFLCTVHLISWTCDWKSSGISFNPWGTLIAQNHCESGFITMELFSGTLLSCDTCNAGSSTGRHFSAFLIVASKDFLGICFKTCKHLFTGQIVTTQLLHDYTCHRSTWNHDHPLSDTQCNWWIASTTVIALKFPALTRAWGTAGWCNLLFLTRDVVYFPGSIWHFPCCMLKIGSINCSFLQTLKLSTACVSVFRKYQHKLLRSTYIS